MRGFRSASLFSLVVLDAKMITLLSLLLVGLDLQIDAPSATVIVACIVAISSMWQSWMLSKVHTLVNSNFTEAKAARVAAESALKTSQDLNIHLQQQLDASSSRRASDKGATGATGATGAQGAAGPVGPVGPSTPNEE